MACGSSGNRYRAAAGVAGLMNPYDSGRIASHTVGAPSRLMGRATQNAGVGGGEITGIDCQLAREMASQRIDGQYLRSTSGRAMSRPTGRRWRSPRCWQIARRAAAWGMATPAPIWRGRRVRPFPGRAFRRRERGKPGDSGGAPDMLLHPGEAYEFDGQHLRYPDIRPSTGPAATRFIIIRILTASV